MGQRLDILREARASVAAAGVEELAADAHVGADALAHHLHVGAHQVAEVGHVVHERDARGQHGVGGVFGHLGRGDVHEKHPEVVDHQRTVEPRHQFARLLAVDAHHHAVGRHEVLDGGTFFEEFGVRGYIEWHVGAAFGELLLDCCAHLAGRAHGDRALGHQKRVFVDVASERAGHFQYVAQIGRAVLVGRRAHGREDHFHPVETLREVGGEVQTPGGDVVADQFGEARFVDRYDTLLQALDLLAVGVDAGDVETHFGEAGTRDETHVAGSNDCDFHFVRVG